MFQETDDDSLIIAKTRDYFESFNIKIWKSFVIVIIIIF